MKNIRKGIIGVCILSALLISNFTFAAISEKYDNGSVDWEQNIIKVTGQGAPPPNATELTAPLLAMRAAKVDAMRNALEIIGNVRVSSSTTLEMMMINSDQVKTCVQGFIKGGQFEEPVYDPKGICTIVLDLPINGEEGLSALMFNNAKPHFVNQEVQSSAIPTPEALESKPIVKPYTGIIIDARNVGVRPALYPQVFDVEGHLLYGPTMVDAQQADYTTMAAYSRTIEKAVAMSRIGDNPLKIKAVSSVKATNGETTDLVLDSDASKAFRSAVSQTDIIAKSAVVIVIN